MFLYSCIRKVYFTIRILYSSIRKLYFCFRKLYWHTRKLYSCIRILYSYVRKLYSCIRILYWHGVNFYSFDVKLYSYIIVYKTNKEVHRLGKSTFAYRFTSTKTKVCKRAFPFPLFPTAKKE